MNAPSYFSAKLPKRTSLRYHLPVAESLRPKNKINELENSIFENDSLKNCTLVELENRLKGEVTNPSGFHFCII